MAWNNCVGVLQREAVWGWRGGKDRDHDGQEDDQVLQREAVDNQVKLHGMQGWRGGLM